MKTKEEAMAMSPAPTATIKIDGWWNYPERHGAMFDLAASEDMKLREGEVKVIPLGIRMKLPEGYFGLVVPRSSTCLKHGIMMANSVGIIEPDYCGDSDVWGFVAYAIRDTVIERGTRIAQFMPVRMFGDLDFDVVDSMPDPDRGGYGSTGEKSNGGEPSFYDRRGRKLSVGCYCRISGTDSCGIVKKLYESEERGSIVLADFSGYGEIRKRCVDVELDDRPRDYDGVPIEVGDVLYQTTFEGNPIGDPMEVEEYIDGTFFVKGYPLPLSARMHTHREPADSWEKLEKDAKKNPCRYFGMSEDQNASCKTCPHGPWATDRICGENMRLDLIERAKKLAGLRVIAGLIDRPACKNLAIKPADELLCSECGEHVDIAYMESADDYHARYCPNCGAEVCDED